MARKTKIVLLACFTFGLMTAPSLAAPKVDALDGPQWPNVQTPDGVPPLPSYLDASQAQWPNIPPQKPKVDLTGSVKPAPQVATGEIPASAEPEIETTSSIPAKAVASRWAYVTPAPFAFEAGARYWYSTGSMRFGFANGNPLYGDPTSTLDWHGMPGHTGEIFGRIDHRPSGVYVKGIAGLGKGSGGQIDDRDYFANQVKFSDTTSDIRGNDISYATIDLGWSYVPAQGGMRFGLFAGYQYWHERATAYGARCNPDDVSGAVCGAPGTIAVPFDTAALIYEPRWHALRVGVDWKVEVAPRWTVSGEAAYVPYAVLRNEDSHLLRQDPGDLGPAPNAISTSNRGYGGSAEMFVNYAVTPNIEIGAGVRYWGLFAASGNVQFGPAFASNLPLRQFDQQRLGGLLQVKGQF